ncbi:MAG: transcription termination/antitermination protein NusG [Alphaproteobacteria bacterium]|nr:transcription termination/antitermination protein NusG [Alphaproteobacteria bacterium]MCB9696109.1 transcription termination/antitermination protein NusG [Alphaproteobacteria bacterium]
MTMRWYAVHTLSGSEDKAMKALQQRIEQHDLGTRFGRVLVPSEVVVDPKTKRKVTRRFYPGYMLVEMDLDNETWHLVKNTPKVTGFVGDMRNPPPVPESEVARVTSLLSPEEEPRPVMEFTVGEEVRLTEGRYASMRGTVEEVNEARGKLRVVINMFGRPVPTELSFHQVEKLS